jgi:O-antigen/teichoic acid export membrane protein
VSTNIYGSAADTEDNDQEVPRLAGLLSYSSPLLLIVLLTTLLTWVDTLMLGYFTTADEVGIYGAATKTAMLTGMILISINTIFAPMIADFYHRKETQRLEKMFKFSGSWIYILSLPFFLMFVLLARDIMALFGDGFEPGWTVLLIISFAYYINASTGSVGNMLIMSGHQKIMMYNSIAVFIFNIVTNYLLIPVYGMNGAAIASCLSIVIYNVLMLVEVYWWLGMHPYNARFIRPTLYGMTLFGIFFIIVQQAAWDEIIRLLVFAPLFLVAYFTLVYRYCIGEEELVIVKKIKTKIGSDSRT